MLRTDRQQNVTILALGKSYDSLDLARLDQVRRSLLDEADHADPPLLALDFTRTEFIGSSFIELLVRAWKRIKQRDGLIVLCRLNPFCEEVFRVARLDQIWEIFPTRQEAIETLNGTPRGP